MRIRLNGADRQAPDDATLAALLASLSLPPGRVAVEVNGQVVARTEFGRTRIREGDVLEVVHFVGGG